MTVRGLKFILTELVELPSELQHKININLDSVTNHRNLLYPN
jgi:hypothetical protein